MKINHKEISIIGGAGHVGFPLGLVFATKKYKVNLIDKNRTFLNKIERGIPPFLEKGSKKLLKKCLKEKNLFTNLDHNSLKTSKFILICIGTPIDNNLKPKIKEFLNLFYSHSRTRNKFLLVRKFPVNFSRFTSNYYY